MKKQPLTPQRAINLFFSVQFMAILAEVLKIEHIHYMDTDFKVPQINNFAGRIKKDAESVLFHLKTHPRLNITNTDQEFTEEYAAELHRVFRFFIGLPIEKIREIMDGWEELANGKDRV